jgi:excinuclease ABC subunit C
MNDKLQTKLANLPESPGIYMMKDSGGKILYIGKAKLLRNRVRSYFQQSRPRDLKTDALTSKISDFEVLVTDNEMEALILENNLIKEHRPRYNVNLKDDKRYPYLKITGEPFPRLLVTRVLRKDGGKYFGPYTEVKVMRQTLRLIRQIFPLRTCNQKLPSGGKHRVCLNYHIGRCFGPCENLISREEYCQIVEGVRRFLAGRKVELLRDLRSRMESLAETEEYEAAARVRDQLQSLETLIARQKVLNPDMADRDIIAYKREGADACCVAMQVREGVLIGRQHFYLSASDSSDEGELLKTFLMRFYNTPEAIPPQVLMASKPKDGSLVARYLSDRAGSGVELVVPQKGEKARLLNLARENAKLLLEELLLEKSEAKRKPSPLLRSLKRDLYLKDLPRRLAAFDISNLGSGGAVGSLVYFVDGQPRKGQYRHFRIKTVEGQDDFAMMAEVVERYFRRLIQEKKELPNLVLIDGGKGQLNSALSTLRKLKIKSVETVALAKRLDEVFLPGRRDPLMIPKTSSSLKLLQRVRDEAHRFAVSYHRRLRKSEALSSELDSIRGIGKKRSLDLLARFGSVERMKAAKLSELLDTPGIPAKVAEAVYTHFHSTGGRPVSSGHEGE